MDFFHFLYCTSQGSVFGCIGCIVNLNVVLCIVAVVDLSCDTALPIIQSGAEKIAQSLMHRHFATICSRNHMVFTRMLRNQLVTRRMGKF